jgi:hypothetical protein
LIKCLSAAEADYVLREIHEGVYRSHSGGWMLAHKATRASYYWPTMGKDSVKFVRCCDKCQRFARVMKNPPENLSSISSPRPFAKWGVYLVRPMPPGKGNKRFLVVAVDYFTKWAEAEALASITTGSITNFLWRSIICQFGIPYMLVTNNGKQFDCELFQKWSADLQICNYYSTPIHPPANEQVEATNKTLLGTFKKKLKKKKKKKKNKKKKRKRMGGVRPGSSVVLLNHYTNTNWKNSFLPNLWNQRNYPNRGGFSKLQGVPLQPQPKR